MLKFLIVGLNLVALFSFKFFFEDEVKVTQELPAKIQAGDTFTVKVNIEKGDRQGFAKWQQTIPLGFIAIAGDTKGATFSFKDQELKLIWMALPDEDSFTITYDLMTEPLMEGTFDFAGKFSFIENNERKDVSSEKYQVEIVTELADQDSYFGGTDLLDTTAVADITEEVVDTMESTIAKAEDTSEEMASNLSADDDQETEKVSETPSKGKIVTQTDQLKISRLVTHLEDAKYQVDLSIEKGELNEFAKVEEYLPPGFIAMENESQSGIFTLEGNVAKVLWMRIPKDTELNISYIIESTTDEMDSVRLHGVFSYLDGEESKQIPMQANIFKNYFVSPEELMANEEEASEAAVETEELATIEEVEQEEESIAQTIEEETTPIEEPIAAEEEVVENSEPVVSEEVAQTATATTDKELEKQITNVPEPESGISYKVQIAAGKNEVGQDYFKKKHQIIEAVSTEYHNGWYKYTVGSFPVYKQARDKRNQIWEDFNQINDAFVTAYNSGERITVQEALMITKQKWYK